MVARKFFSKFIFAVIILHCVLQLVSSLQGPTVHRSSRWLSPVPSAQAPPITKVQKWSLYASSSYVSQVRDRLGLEDRFGRWRYLQRLLEDETAPRDANDILYAVLDGYINFPRPKFGSSDETGSPERTEQRLQRIQAVLEKAVGESVPFMTDNESVYDPEIMRLLEMVLPDPQDDEEDFKAAWDMMIELNGRESVKINERDGRPEWKARCMIARIIIYYDFITYGIVDAPISEK